MPNQKIDCKEEIERCFTYQKPDENQTFRFEQLHNSLVRLGFDLLKWCPNSSDRDRAFEALRECRMWANSAIAHKGRY